MGYRFHIIGVVQGVGFRPYIYNACKAKKLTGFVQNIGSGVVIEVNDEKALEEILKNIPPLARIDKVEVSENKNIYKDFTIKKSKGKGFAEIPPDLFLCPDCQKDLFDPKNRRYHYFFTTCTNCGPRYSMIKKTPYDRETTTMEEFVMCPECKKEYEDPENRRYHAQTIACPNCGPKLKLYLKNKIVGKDIEAIRKTAELLKKGEIVAIKGVGGFHLSCKINKKSVEKLRKITGRKDKPYALMCRDLEMIKKIAEVNKKEEELLESVQRPIVVLAKKKKLNLVSELDTVGVMLAYTALHFLLFEFIDEPIIMTSSNVSGSPITIERKEQFVDYVLDYDRKIENSVDDSVMKVIAGKKFFLRRSRGFVPQSIFVGGKAKKQVLAMGAEMNSSFCLYKYGRTFLSPYLGDTSKLEAFSNYKKTLDKFLEFMQVKPQLILIDEHPIYNVSRYGQELAKKWKVPVIKIQHHQAHSYSVASENNLNNFNAITCDGLGYGEDGKIWGGEVFANNKRIGHLEYQSQIGGDLASLEPARMLLAILRKFMDLLQAKKYLCGFYNDEKLEILDKQLAQKFNCQESSSCGRILDAASFLLGFCKKRTYEGRPAMLLDAYSTNGYKLEPVIENKNGVKILMTTPLFEFLVKNINKDKLRLAATVQEYLIKGLWEIAEENDKKIVFSGGVSYSRIMSRFVIEHGGLVNEKVPAGDGGVSFGQIGWWLRNGK